MRLEKTKKTHEHLRDTRTLNKSKVAELSDPSCQQPFQSADENVKQPSGSNNFTCSNTTENKAEFTF